LPRRSRSSTSRRAAGCFLLLSALPPTPALAQAEAPADAIFVGEVVTMDPAAPRAEAVAMRGARIVAVGTRAEVMAWRREPVTRVVELGQRALLPGFIDAHGHLTASAAISAFASLRPPPAGPVASIAALQAARRRHIQERAIPGGRWVVGFGYDDTLLAEGRHPTRDELDAVSAEHPVFVVHVSGHLSAANSRLLAMAGLGPDSPDPVGGVIRRRAGTREPDGVLEEAAHWPLYFMIPKPDPQEALARLARALDGYARAGITTVQDGAATPADLALLAEAARLRRLSLDVVAYRLLQPAGAPFPAGLAFGEYRDRLALGGVKLILDGAPQGKTAYLSAPYLVPPPGLPGDYRGYPAMPAEVVAQAVREAVERGVPLLAHANGDAAAQMLIDAVAAAKRDTVHANGKVVMIHAQTVRDDQLDRMAALGIVPSFFVDHAYYWGDWHREQTLGYPRAERISPARSALERGLPFTLHNDAPIAPPDILRTLSCATTRRTRSNDILGPQQRLTTAQALAAVTIDAARQYGEDHRKGSIRAGKLADLVVLSGNPLTTPPERLLELRVIETISHGQSVYREPGT
jgi:predicted amidohydrolase YtcJ